jgi:hypothetical protein
VEPPETPGRFIPLPDLGLVPTEYLELVEQLARVQAETNTSFPLPDEIDADDVATLHRITRLLDGEPLALRPESINVTLMPGALSRQPDIQHGRVLAMQDESSQMLMGEVIPLGVCNIVIGPARFEEEANSDLTLPPSHTRARLVPLPGARAILRRGPLVTRQDVAGTDEDIEE